MAAISEVAEQTCDMLLGQVWAAGDHNWMCWMLLAVVIVWCLVVCSMRTITVQIEQRSHYQKCSQFGLLCTSPPNNSSSALPGSSRTDQFLYDVCCFVGKVARG
jgi:hypothetical protein